MSTPSSKALHIALWVAQVVLGAMFIMAGSMKVMQPIEALAPQMAFVTYSPEALVRFIGISEVLGGLGLILPSLLRIMPKLTPLAAAGLTIIMVLAVGLHISEGEPFIPALVLGVIAAFIAWGRYAKAPIQAK